MRILVMIMLVLFFSRGFAQEKDPDNNTVERTVRETENALLHELAGKITRNCSSEKEKARAIFSWIAGNIEYSIPRKSTFRGVYEPEEEEDNFSLQPLDERVAEKVLRKRTAYCDGYARLFKVLCLYSGIEAETITGYGRTNIGRDRSFRSNHTWNAVRLNGEWHLLDVTWATGFLSMANGQFIKRFDDFYFLTDPQRFVQDHYPDDLRWTLLPDPPVIREFEGSPFRATSLVKYPGMGFMPRKGILRVSVGDTVRIILETSQLDSGRKVASDFFFDSTYQPSPSWAFLTPVVSADGKTCRYEFPVVSDRVEWLHILYNDDLVLRYRLQVNKKEGM